MDRDVMYMAGPFGTIKLNYDSNLCQTNNIRALAGAPIASA